MKLRLAAGVLVGLLLLCPSVAAHATFLESEPPQGARLAEPPARVRVVLSQEVDPTGSSLRVLDATGASVDEGDFQVEPGEQPVFTVSLNDDIADGAYRVEWKALSRVDHHTTQGSFGFAVGNFTPPDIEEAPAQSPTVPSLVGRTVFFVGLFLAVGSVLFGLVVVRGSARPFLDAVDRIGWPLIVAGSAILLGDAVSRTGLTPGQWLVSAVLRDLVIRLVLAAVMAGVALAVPGTNRVRSVSVTLGLLLVAAFSARSGHGSGEGFAWIVVDVVHLLATASWVGGLLLFGYALVATKRPPILDGELVAAGRSFSHAALAAVIIMAATGLLLSATILGLPTLDDPFAWFAGVYGTALLGKIVLAGTMVALAAANRFVFLSRFVLAPSSPVRTRFGRFVVAEAAIGVVVLVLAAVLTSASPSYDGAADEGPIELSGESDTFHVTMRLSAPPVPGGFSSMEFQIVWKEDNSTLVNNTCGREEGCLLLEVVAPGAQEHDEDETDVHQGGEHRFLEPRGDGWWTVEDVVFVEEGMYRFLVEIQTEYVFFDVVELDLHVGDVENHDEHAGH